MYSIRHSLFGSCNMSYPSVHRIIYQKFKGSNPCVYPIDMFFAQDVWHQVKRLYDEKDQLESSKVNY